MSKKAAPAPPVFVDNYTVRSDDDVPEGAFCQVVNGEHAGVRGAFVSVLEHGDDGYPKTIEFRSRDERQETFAVPYKDVRPVPGYNGGR